MMMIFIQIVVVVTCFEACFSYRLVFRRRPRGFLTFPKFPCTSSGVQWVRHPRNCSIYYVCGHGIPHHMPTCPPDRVWSNSVTNCVPSGSRWDDCDYWTNDSEHSTKNEASTTSQQIKVSSTRSLMTKSNVKNDIIDYSNDFKQRGSSTVPTQRNTEIVNISQSSKTKKDPRTNKSQTSATTTGIRLWSKEGPSSNGIHHNSPRHWEPTTPSIPICE